MPWLFSYGTLREPAVQLATFGRLLDRHQDELVGYELSVHRVTDPEFVASSGKADHAIVMHTGHDNDRVRGMVLELTDDELEMADTYEPAGYFRVAARLASGREAWVYAGAARGQSLAPAMRNRDSYNAIALQWDAARATTSPAERRFLHSLLRDIPTGSRVLDLGCGTGRPMAEYILHAGYAVTGVDQAANLLAIARDRMPTGEWTESTLEEYVPVRKFSAALAWDSLFHIPREHHKAIFQTVCSALSRGGRFMMTVGGSEHPAFNDEMFGHQFAYDSHAPETVLSLLHDVGFEIEFSEFLNEPTDGRDKGRFAILARVKS